MVRIVAFLAIALHSPRPDLNHALQVWQSKLRLADWRVTVEIVDDHDRIAEFLETAKQMIEEAACGAMITIEKAEVIHYKSKRV